MTYPTKKLGEVIDLKYGKGIARHDRNDAGKVPIYGANGILGWTNKSLAAGEAIIVGRKGSAGEVARVNGKFYPSDVTYYIFGNKKVDIDYLYYFFKEFDLRKLAVGVKPGINRNRVYEINIPLPPLPEQKKIVKKIEELFGKIDEAQKLREQAQVDAAALIPAALHQIFEKGKKGWKEKSINEMTVIQSGGTPSKAISKYWENGNIPWLRSEACKDEFINSADRFITQEGLENSSAKLLKSRSTLIALVGATIGKTGFLTFESTTNQNIAGLYPRDERLLLPEYLFIIAKNLYPHFTHIGKGKFKMANLSFVKSLKFLLPPLPEQKKIVAYLDSLSEKAKKLQELQQQTTEDLKALKQSILQKAFRGEFVK